VPAPVPEDKAPPAPPPGPPRYASPPSRRELMLFRVMFLAGGLFLLAAILIGTLVGARPS
jgi:hypothetical protein